MKDPTLKEKLPHQNAALKLICICTAVCGALYSAVNMQRGLYILAGLEFYMAALAGYVLFLMQKNRPTKYWVHLFLLCFCSIMMYAMQAFDTQPTVFVWVFLVPVLSYVALGSSNGMLFTVVFSAGAAVMSYLKVVKNDSIFGIVDFMDIFLSWLAIWILMHQHEESREKAQQKLSKMAFLDVLTGLGNRLKLDDWFEQQALDTDSDTARSLLLFDLDGFSGLNDEYGHKAADQILMSVAELLSDETGKDADIYRIGSDEFCVLLADTEFIRATVVAKLLCEKLSQRPLVLNDSREVIVTMSAGVAFFRAGASRLDTLLAEAGECLRQAQQAGGNRATGADIELPPREGRKNVPAQVSVSP